jgi:hypothetical protein
MDERNDYNSLINNLVSNQTTPKEYTQKLVDRIMFSTSLTHLDEVKEIASIIVKEIKLNSLDEALPFFNNVLKEIEKL